MVGDRQLAIVLLIACVVVAAAPAVMGQSQNPAPQSRILLDADADHLGSIAMSGERYHLVRYENTLPFASGVEAYTSDGSRLTSVQRAMPAIEGVAAITVLTDADAESVSSKAAAVATGQATQVFQSVAWRQAAQQLSADDIQTLQNIRQTTQNIQQVVNRPEAALERIINFVDGLKNQQVMGQSAWSLLTQAAPSLEGFDQAARSLHSELETWKEAAADANTNIPQVVQQLEQVKQGQSVDYETLSQRFSSTMDALERLSSQSSELSSGLSRVASLSGEAANGASNVPVIGGRIASEFRSVQQALNQGAEQVSNFAETLNQQQQQLGNVRSMAQTRTQELRSAWQAEVTALESEFKARENAQLKVYGTVGGGSVLGIGVLGVVLRRTVL